MEATVGCLADFVQNGDRGKINILGVFQTLYAANFPTSVAAQFFVVVMVDFEQAFFGKALSSRLVLLDPEQRVIGEWESAFVCHPPDPPEPRVTQSFIFQMVGQVLELPGMYQFQFSVENQNLRTIFLNAMELREEPTVG